MKLRELFETEEMRDLDVCNTYTDEIFPCISLPQRGLTQEGSEVFNIALDLEIEICDNDPAGYSDYIIVHVDDDVQLKALRSFCYAQAGYIPEENYCKWFQEAQDEE